MCDEKPPSPSAIVDSLLAFTPLLIYRADLSNLTVLYASPSLSRLLGYEVAEVVGVDGWWLSHIHPEDRARVLAGLQKELAERAPARVDEYRIRHRNGRYHWFRSTGRLEYDGAGRPTQSTGYMLEITQQKRAEEALRESERHFRSLIENGSDLITVLGVDRTLRYVSPSVERALGYTPSRVLGKDALELIHRDDHDRAAAALDRAVEVPGSIERLELRLRHADGSWRTFEVAGQSLLHDPAVAGVVVTSRDITERRQAEEALWRSEADLKQAQKMEAVGRLAGGVAHDFNNLLTVISGYGQLLLGRLAEGGPERRFTEGIQAAAQQAIALTTQLLAFSRKQVLEPKVLDLNTVVARQQTLLRRLIEENIELATSLEPALARIEADPGQIEQVIMNLALNGRDAMPGGGRLTIATANVELDARMLHANAEARPGSYVLLAVTDTGTGMCRETLSHIYEPFFTTKGPGKGTGLGLSIVYGIVRQSGGHIVVESEVGRGTTFRVYLPRAEGTAAAPRPSARPGNPLHGSETALVVEDREDVRSLIREVLELHGYTVLAAENGGAAVRIAEEHRGPIHLLVTDLIMPRMSGRSLAERLTVLRPEIRVLFVSGYTEETKVLQNAAEAAFLQKPFTPAALAQKVREVLDSPVRAGG